MDWRRLTDLNRGLQNVIPLFILIVILLVFCGSYIFLGSSVNFSAFMLTWTAISAVLCVLSFLLMYKKGTPAYNDIPA